MTAVNLRHFWIRVAHNSVMDNDDRLLGVLYHKPVFFLAGDQRLFGALPVGDVDNGRDSLPRAGNHCNGHEYVPA